MGLLKAYEGNVLWNTEIFEEIAHGAEMRTPTEIPAPGESPTDRRLFWVQLRLRRGGSYCWSFPSSSAPGGRGGSPAPWVLVGNTHLSWQGNAEEVRGGSVVRLAQAQGAVAALLRKERELREEEEEEPDSATGTTPD